MLGFDNPIHLLFLGVLLLLVFGAKRLPEMGRSLGAGMRGFRESISGESPHPAELGPPRQSAAPSGERVQAASQAGEPQA
jgi:sec-independent protein translocase protein TatA